MTGFEDVVIPELLPHGEEAVAVSKVLELSGDRALCEGLLPKSSPFRNGGNVPSFVAVEFAAQSCAVAEALRGVDQPTGGKGISEGYLARIRDMEFAPDGFDPDLPMTAEVVTETLLPPLGMYRVKVEQQGREILSGSFSAWLRARES